MDDLLSTALTESGLGDYFTVNGVTKESPSEQQEQRLISQGGSETSECSSPTGQEVAQRPSVETSSNEGFFGSSSTSNQEITEAPAPIERRPTAVARPGTNGVRVVLRRGADGIDPTRALNSQLIRRTIQTSSGTRTQILKPVRNENGEVEYREIKFQQGNIRRGGGPGGATTRIIPSTSAPTAQKRMVIVKQQTPNGPRFVKQILPAGAEVRTEIDQRGQVVRRIVTRGQPLQAGQIGLQRPAISLQRAAPDMALHQQPGGQAIRKVASGPVFNTVARNSRPLQALERVNYRPSTPNQQSRPTSRNDYSPIHSPGGRALPNVNSSPSFNKIKMQSRTGIQPMSANDIRKRLPPIAQPQQQPRSSVDIDEKKLQQQKEDKQFVTAKSQKAKEEMKQAMISGRHRIDDEEDDNLGYAETYSDYRPAKLRSGLAHPDSVVETASLSSVAPPDVTYTCTMPEYLIDTGSISALQLEAVIYACQAHERRLPSGERCGYLIGDGAGVGKGRTVAGIIFENYLLGRKRSIWLSVSSDLRFDSERDLRDIGASRIKVHPLNKLKYAKINGSENGNIKKGCIFATYSSLIGECRTASKKYRSRLNQLVQWFGVDYDGAIIFDECHRAKNLVPGAGGKSTKTGKVVLELQKCLPNARIVYASATGATEPRNMAYMTRLGLWGTGQAFHEFQDFINAVERRGVGAMEVVAMDMKQRGLYLARQLSFRGVSFRVEEVTLSDEFIKVYDESVKLWMECRRQFQVVLSTMSDSERSTNKHIWGQFWAAHQRFFKYLCIGAKVEACVRMCREAIKNNKCVVIGLQSTGESRTNEVLEEAGGELSEFVSTAKAVLSGLIEKNFPTERGNCVDVFRDFDRMYDEFDSRPKKRKAPGNPFGLDVLAELGLTLPKSQKSKRGRIENGESTSNNDSDDEDEDDENTSNMSDEDTDSEPEVKIGDNDADWVNALLAEAASSSDTDNNEEEEESHKSAASDTDDKQKLITSANTESSGEEDVDEFNPFFYDFSRGDPYLKNSSAVRKKEKTEEEIEEERRKKRIRKKQKKRKLVKEHQKLERKKQKRELQTQAMQSTANEFISSSRIIDGYHVNPQIIKAELLAAVERLGPQLPTNTLDQLIDELGGPEYVAEMTGRKGRIVTRPDGEIEYELRSAAADVPLELMNMDEKDKFMKGEKLVAVISEAASSGISLQSDKRAENQRRRVHITLELPWSADKAIQQFGRTHRSNQVSAPEYVFLISELAGEKRFASIVAKRLESLGALTHGDRRATETRDLSQFNLDNKYGRAALDVMLKSVIGALSPPLIEPPKNYKPGDFFADMRLYLDGVGVLSKLDNGQYAIEREGAMISKFLNRILGLPVHAQNALFQYFTEIVTELVKQAKHDGTYDMGIMDLGTGGDQVQKQETRIFLGKAEKGSFRVDINKIGVERGIPWEDAHAIYLQHNTGEDGFYVSTPQHSIRKVITLVYGIGKRRLDTGDRLYALTRPATGRSAKMETYNDLIRRFGKVSPEEAEIIWKNQYESSQNMCQHKYVYGRCRNEENHKYCETGRSTRTYFVLSGSVLSVWPVVESVLNDSDSRSSSKIQVIRVRTDTDQKIVGLLVLPHFVRQLVLKLEEHCGRSFIEAKKEKVIPPPPLMTREEILNQLD